MIRVDAKESGEEMSEEPWHRGRPPRDVILERAIRVFAADGYTAGSLNAIATGIGITRQLLLHYFPRKEAILLAVLDDWDSLAEEEPTTDTSRCPIPDPHGAVGHRAVAVRRLW